MVDVSEELAAQIICEAYRRHMYGDNYLWILPGFHSTRYFWGRDTELIEIFRWMHSGRSNCLYSELAQVLEGHFALEFALARRDKESKIIGGKVRHFTKSKL